jgi:predicted RNA binding protein YcfA (HicA-like mRNA interferase family)
MKRRDLVRHLEQQGGNHSVYVNREKRKTSTLPRHREVNDHLAKKICRDLEIQEP